MARRRSMLERVKSAAKGAKAKLDDARVKAMDQIVSMIANREVDTSPRGTRDEVEEMRAPPAPKESEVMKEKGGKEEKAVVKKEEPVKRAPTPAPSSNTMMAKAGPRPDPRIEIKTDLVEPAKIEPDYGIFAALPPKYASHRLALIARDPKWAFAYWDVDRSRGGALFESGAQAVLRLHDANDGRVLQSPRVHAENGRYYFRLPAADQRYQVTLTSVLGDGKEVEVLRSNVVLAPPDLPRPEREARFVSMSKQIAVLEQSRQVHRPPRLVDEDARRASIYPTPSVAGQSLTLMPAHEKPRAAPVEEGETGSPGPTDEEISEWRAIHTGSETVYVGIGTSSGELLKKKERP